MNLHRRSTLPGTSLSPAVAAKARVGYLMLFSILSSMSIPILSLISLLQSLVLGPIYIIEWLSTLVEKALYAQCPKASFKFLIVVDQQVVIILRNFHERNELRLVLALLHLINMFGVMFCVESVYNFVCVFVESKHRVANISDTDSDGRGQCLDLNEERKGWKEKKHGIFGFAVVSIRQYFRVWYQRVMKTLAAGIDIIISSWKFFDLASKQDTKLLDLTVIIILAPTASFPHLAAEDRAATYGADSYLTKTKDVFSSIVEKGYVLGKALAVRTSDKVQKVDQNYQVSQKIKSAVAKSVVFSNKYVSIGASWVTVTFNSIAKAAAEVTG
ncbi:hypothetical protein DCAR_0728837 [Daucus carota subsp. sativus]|uniref:Uncharacterized protein n=1 Tax=Daucus carota subsp. sativus TaxID=79200 RepID=A0A164TVT2_DAUCS|nr:hypothetical protein DCAR_0728837 [Daucus carota subsp. sativus]